MAATRENSRFAIKISLGLAAVVLVVGFQNCSVDMTASTPGASTSGACAPTPAQLTAIQPVFDNFVRSNCAGCHGVTTGSNQTPFYTPDAASNGTDSAVQQFLFVQLCSRGGLAVGLKIDGTNSHVGGTFTRGAPPANALYDYLTANF